MLWLIGVLTMAVAAVFLLTALIGAPYVPTRQREAREAFTQLRPLAPEDVVLDIGSGDGVVLGVVAQAGSQAIGYEINPFLVAISRWRLRKHREFARVRLRNFWRAPFPDATTVVYTFGDSRDIAKMHKKVQREATRLNRTIDLVSYGFEVPGEPAVRTHRAHFLYTLTPLH